jgi:hypothetical protein
MKLFKALKRLSLTTPLVRELVIRWRKRGAFINLTAKKCTISMA